MIATGSRRPVLVGVDYSSDNTTAVAWAAAEADALGVPLQVVGGYLWGLLSPWTGAANPQITGQLRHDSQTAVAKAVASVRERYPELDVTSDSVESDPIDLLRERGKQAAMIVVGTRHLHAIGRAVLGSVSSALAATATTPVVVTCGPSGLAEERAAVVAGLSGRAGTDEILGFAFAQAQALGLPLRTVLCWRPFLDGGALGNEAPQERAERWLAESLAGWRERYPEVDLHPSVANDHAVAGLVAASNGQHLLVVGRHGSRTRPGALLGSVSQGVLHHATCPVAVIPVPQGA